MKLRITIKQFKMEDSSTNPNFAVICSFIDIYGSKLNLPEVTFASLQAYLEETRYGLYYYHHTKL